MTTYFEELDGPAVSAFVEVCNVGDDRSDGLGGQEFIISSSSVLRKARKLLVQAAFVVVSTHQSALGLRRKGLYPSSRGVNRLMMVMMMTYFTVSTLHNLKQSRFPLST
jgi:hypothetical protein